MASEDEIKARFSQLGAWLDERSRRLWAAAESAAHGRGGISLVARASGVSRRAIVVGLAELKKKPERSQRTRLPIRQKGGGRKKASLKDPDLLLDLEKLLEPVTRGDPQPPLRWTCKKCKGDEIPEERPASNFHRHEKEGTGRGLQEWGPRMAAERSARNRPGA